MVIFQPKRQWDPMVHYGDNALAILQQDLQFAPQRLEEYIAILCVKCHYHGHLSLKGAMGSYGSSWRKSTCNPAKEPAICSTTAG